MLLNTDINSSIGINVSNDINDLSIINVSSGSDMVYNDAILSIGIFASFLVLFAVVIILLFIFYFIINQKYPIVYFDVIEGKRKIKTKRRLLGDLVVPDNLLQILLNGNRLFGFKISDFDYYFDNDKHRTYIATRRGTELIPLRITETGLELTELGMAREIAMRYINAIDSTKQDLDKQNPIILALISVLPIGVLVILTGVMFYLILNDALPKMINANVEIAKLVAKSSENMKVVAEVLDTRNHASRLNLTNMTTITVPR